jgi:FG-GAP-like repeat
LVITIGVVRLVHWSGADDIAWAIERAIASFRAEWLIPVVGSIHHDLSFVLPGADSGTHKRRAMATILILRTAVCTAGNTGDGAPANTGLSRVAKCLVFTVLGLLGITQPVKAGAQPIPSGFFIKSYMGRCMDFGVSSQLGGVVTIADCNQSTSQQVIVEELLPTVNPLATGHQVRLHAGSFCIASKADPPANGTELVLKECSTAAGQIFVLDGDSIILDSNRDLAAQLKESITTARTPLVLGSRNLSDVEFWDISAVDGSARMPTTGFKTVSDATGLEQALAAAGPGTVIQIAPGMSITFVDLPMPLSIPAGVTVRGGRRGVTMGPLVWLTTGHDSTSAADDPGLFIMQADNSRITGLRIQGPGRDPKGTKPVVKGIDGVAGFSEIVDHNDLSDWTRTAVDLKGPGENPYCQATLLAGPQPINVFRNYIHDNLQNGGASEGYGVAAGAGAYPLAFGNTFQKNVHSITSDGYVNSGYVATSNLFQSGNASADADLHGETGTSGDIHHDGGISGMGAQVNYNSFLRNKTGGSNSQENFSTRGVPCTGALSTFYGNVTVEGLSDSVTVYPPGSTSDNNVSWVSARPRVPYVRVSSQFSIPDPTKFLLVGDFDGDGKDDVFMATGAAWYYSPGGNAEWRFLSAKTELADTLLIGDFDADGRADVFTQIGDTWMISWGGRSPWQVLSTNHNAHVGPPNRGILDFVIGDFVGDKRADVFYADGANWWVSDGGVAPFTLYASSSFLRDDLGFGDFDGDGKMDVVGVVDNQWMFTPSGGSHQWTPLRSKLTNTIKGLIVADFDGDGKADIAGLVSVPNSNGQGSQDVWEMSKDGTDDWKPVPGLSALANSIAIGRFDDQAGADVLTWSNDLFELSSFFVATPQRQSRQGMR